MSAPELVYLHIPKTAGTSQRRAFQRHYGKSRVYWHSRNNEAYSKEAIGESVVVGGHKGLAFYPPKLDALFCAVVRDPIERAVSLFRYYTQPTFAPAGNRAMTSERARARIKEKSLDPDSMLRSIKQSKVFRQEICNRQCVYLSMSGNRFKGVRKSLKKRDHLIGTASRYDLFHRELTSLLGWPESEPVFVNRSSENYAAPFLQDRELVELLLELNQEDQKLFLWIENECEGIWSGFSDDAKRSRRLQSLPLVDKKVLLRERRDEIDAAQYWPKRQRRMIQWPLSHCVISKSCKLAYAPQPGAVDSAIKKMLVELSSIEHKNILKPADFDWVTDRFITGILLDDWSREDVAAMTSSGKFFVFAVVYEPVKRLIDLFEQRFVVLRKQLSNWEPLYQLLVDAQRQATPDLHLGVSFRQFVHGCISGRYQHRLLFTQARYLPWADHYDRFYSPGQLGELRRDLAELCGFSVRLPEPPATESLNAVSKSAIYADTPAGRLPSDPSFWRTQLLDEELLAKITHFYARDFKLYNRTQGPNERMETR